MNKEQILDSLPKYQPTQAEFDCLKRTSQIINLCNPEQITGMATPQRVEGRKIIEWSGYCGTYGQGGPGFFGLELEATNELPKEWLILTLWGANDWLEINGKWVSAHPDQYQIQEPLYLNFSLLKKDEVTPLLKDKILRKFNISEKSAVLEIGDSYLKINEDPTTRPIKTGNKELRKLATDDNLKNAWIISPVPWVEV